MLVEKLKSGVFLYLCLCMVFFVGAVIGEENPSSVARIEDYLDSHDSGAHEELAEYYQNVARRHNILVEDEDDDGNCYFFYFYSITEKNADLRRRCKILSFLILLSFSWTFLIRRFGVSNG